MNMHVNHTIMNLILLTSVISLFLYIKWYFSIQSSNVKSRLHTYEIILTLWVGFVVYFVITNKALSLSHRYIFFILMLGLHIGTGFLSLKSLRRKKNVFPKSYLIFHKGKFFRGVILQNQLSESDIITTLRLKGVSDLSEVDSIILEADGELTIIYKEKLREAA